MGQQDKILLNEPVEEKLGRLFPVLQQWVRNMVLGINRYIRDFLDKLKTGQQDIL